MKSYLEVDSVSCTEGEALTTQTGTRLPVHDADRARPEDTKEDGLETQR